MTALWTAAEAVAATGGRTGADWTAHGVSIDTRTLRRGDLFVALTGQARDGHAFVGDALEKGAAAALVSRAPDGFGGSGPLLTVPDTLEALRALGAAARARMAGRVIGVTGSVGKTGVKEMLRVMLTGQGATHASEGSHNNHWGVPLTLARMPADTAFAVIEMGMNHAREIAPLTTLARPHVALITTVAPAHLEHFPDEAAIADAKAEIFEGLEPGGVAILNRDNRWFDRLAAAGRARGARIVAFGADARADARLLAAETRRGGAVSIASASLGGVELVFKLGAPGRHLTQNALGALAAAQAAGADLALAALALADWRAPAGRGARWLVTRGPGGVDGVVEVVDESYNANPASVGAALEVLAATPVKDDVGRIARGRRIACLGDMLELGEAETAAHAGLAEHPAMALVDLVFAVGPRMRALHDALPKNRRGGWFATSQEAAERLRRFVDGGDVVMVKGSKSMAMGAVVAALKTLGPARDAAAAEEA
jgi:UDP-N-acetylmuramoyl-tripeptide--D-alanyl-D-alanine ligase